MPGKHSEPAVGDILLPRFRSTLAVGGNCRKTTNQITWFDQLNNKTI